MPGSTPVPRPVAPGAPSRPNAARYSDRLAGPAQPAHPARAAGSADRPENRPAQPPLVPRKRPPARASAYATDTTAYSKSLSSAHHRQTCRSPDYLALKPPASILLRTSFVLTFRTHSTAQNLCPYDRTRAGFATIRFLSSKTEASSIDQPRRLPVRGRETVSLWYNW